MRVFVFTLAIALVAATSASAAVVSNTTHDTSHTGLDGSIAVGDLISGMIATELPGDLGWHSANTNPADQLVVFTDDAGALSGLTGLLNDYGAGNPVKRVQYTLANASDISEIQILTGNGGKDGRVFSTTVVSLSSDNGANFSQLGYFQSDASGTINAGEWGSTLVEITEDQSGVLGSGVTDLVFEFYSVDNNGGQMRDPFDGVNPFTGADDLLTGAFVSPLVYEIDVIGTAVPEPTSVVLMGLGVLVLLGRRRS